MPKVKTVPESNSNWRVFNFVDEPRKPWSQLLNSSKSICQRMFLQVCKTVIRNSTSTNPFTDVTSGDNNLAIQHNFTVWTIKLTKFFPLEPPIFLGIKCFLTINLKELDHFFKLAINVTRVQFIETIFHEQIVLQSYERQIGNPWSVFPWTPLILPQDKNKYSVKWSSSEVSTFTLSTSSFTNN